MCQGIQLFNNNKKFHKNFKISFRVLRSPRNGSGKYNHSKEKVIRYDFL